MTTPKKKIDLKINTGEYVTPITKASNVIFKDGKTAQEILSDTDDNISDIISNSNSSFKIGCGDDADYSENVVDGAFNTIVLKGKSAVNLIKDDSSANVNNYYEFDTKAGNYRILADISEDNYPCSIRINNSNSESYKGDSVFTLPEGTNTVSFSDPNIKNVIVMEDNIKGNIPCYFKGICDVTAPIIKNINEDGSYSNETVIDHDIDGNIIHLRSLPNGVYDELDLKTGKLTQRVEESIFDGSTNNITIYNAPSSVPITTDNYLIFNLNTTDRKANSKYLKNCPAGYGNNFDISNTEYFGGEFYGDISTPNMFVFKIEKNKLETKDLDGFKKWLQENPIILQYELSEPIIKYVNINDYPFAYENGSVILSSNTEEPSLTPTIEYSVPFNRNGQISMNSKLVTRQQKQIDTLEAIIIANLVDTQYRQSLTAINYNLEE